MKASTIPYCMPVKSAPHRWSQVLGRAGDIATWQHPFGPQLNWGKYIPGGAFPSRHPFPFPSLKSPLNGFTCFHPVDFNGRAFALKPPFLLPQYIMHCVSLIIQIFWIVTPASCTFALSANLNVCSQTACFQNPSIPLLLLTLAMNLVQDSER